MTNLIKEQRKKSGLLQYYVAQKLGMSTKTLQRIENGDREPTEEEYNELAIIFKCNVLELRQKKR